MASAATRLFHHLGAALDCLGAALDCDRVLAYCRILIVAETVGLLFLVAGTHGLIVPLSRPTSTDFVSFYAAGALANAGTPELVYDQSAHHAAEERATAIGVEYRFFYYPPVFLLVCAALARLPYLAAFLAFEGVTLALFLVVMCEILDRRGWSALIPVLAFPALYWTLGLGQNSFLTAALFAAGTLWIDRRPILAGICFGALCYKPQFRPSGSGRAAGRAALARLCRRAADGRCALRLVAGPVRLGGLGRFSPRRFRSAYDL